MGSDRWRLCAVTLMAVLVGCGGQEREPVAALPTVTATATVTMEVTATATVTITASPPASAAQSEPPEPAEPSGLPEPTPPPDQEEFDRAWLLEKAGDAMADIRSVDERLKDGIGVASALYLLSDSYGRMADAGTPPGLDSSGYLARLDTLQEFAQVAGDQYDSNPSEATAKYTVVRQETGVLFDQINTALGTDLRLP